MKNPDKTFNHRQLYWLLDRIVAEEQSFKRNCSGVCAGGACADRPGSSPADRRDSGRKSGRDKPTRRVLADRHREYLSEHELLLQRCFAVARQARAGLLSEREAAFEVARLRRDLRRLRGEHGVIERESH
ncbi:MAG: hypothetical protein JSW34_06310 [Candidatus Zixiibacteriota bacterium]|nr:MAG: hypothetical protein JSW34_06310 [candidate division Zixibacteria bacterium]